jgi:hypothetical protein
MRIFHYRARANRKLFAASFAGVELAVADFPDFIMAAMNAGDAVRPAGAFEVIPRRFFIGNAVKATASRLVA